MATITQLLIGSLTCLVFILVARQVGLKREAIIYAVALVVAALVYVAFAAFSGAPFSWIALESGGLVLFLLLALLGLKSSLWFLVAGWAAHAIWDALLHKILMVGFVPEWYPIVCLVFDLFLAAYIATSLKRGRWLAASRQNDSKQEQNQNRER